MKAILLLAVAVLLLPGCLGWGCGHSFGHLTWTQKGAYDALKNSTIPGKYRPHLYEHINVTEIDCCAPEFAASHMYFNPDNTIEYAVIKNSKGGQSELENDVRTSFAEMGLPKPTFAGEKVEWTC